METNKVSEQIYFKCVSNEYSTFVKGKIYRKDIIGRYLLDYPDDFKPVLPYPTTQELIDAITDGKNVTKILRSLKQWKNIK